MTDTLITSEVDFAATGKHHGYLRLPHSVHRSAYGWIPVPVVSVRNGDGATILLMSGNHGDEYEGQIALTKLARSLQPKDVQGQVIILTMANFPAAQAGLRTSPIDGGNLNRTFPGDPHGNPTQMIAHYVEKVLLARCDYFIDLHSGGSSLFYPATLLRCPGHDPQETAKLLALQEAFDLPYAWVFAGGGGPDTTARTAMGAAGRAGVTTVMAELGGGGTVSRDILARTERGLKRVLHSLGMLPDYAPDAALGTRELTGVGMLYAYDSGVFEPNCDIGDMIQAGDLAGVIHSPDAPWRDPVIVPFTQSGMILCKRFMGQVSRGDALFQVVADAR